MEAGSANYFDFANKFKSLKNFQLISNHSFRKGKKIK